MNPEAGIEMIFLVVTDKFPVVPLLSLPILFLYRIFCIWIDFQYG